MQVLIILGMLWLPESPEFYFAKGRFEESKLVLLQIAKINNRNIGHDAICFENVEKETSEESDDDKNEEEKKEVIDISRPCEVKEKKEKAPKQRHCKGTLGELI